MRTDIRIDIMKNKKIVIGVSGGIACYKIPELIRKLKKEGAEVFVVMTENACKFITPLTFRTISGNNVLLEMFDEKSERLYPHIDLAAEADAVLVAPATANIIAKVACGIADDLLSTFLLSTDCKKIIIAPSMNSRMYENVATQENLEKLKKRGIEMVGPERGELACGKQGIGRLSDTAKLLESISKKLKIK